MIKRRAWVKYPSNPTDPERYPAIIKQVYIVEFIYRQGYHNPNNSNFDISPEAVAICIDAKTGKYSEESLYWLYDREPSSD